MRADLKKLELDLTRAERHVQNAKGGSSGLTIEVVTPMSAAFVRIVENYASFVSMNTSAKEKNLVLSTAMLKLEKYLRS